MAWARPEAADDTIWENAGESLEKSPGLGMLAQARQNLLEEFEEEAGDGGIQSLALGGSRQQLPGQQLRDSGC